MGRNGPREPTGEESTPASRAGPAASARAPREPTRSRPRPGSAGGARSPARRLGRKAAFGVYYAIVVAVIATAAVQISVQLFGGAAAKPPYSSCSEGVYALAGAVDRARRAARGVDGEDAALARFRTQLEPEWTFRDAVASACRASREGERALDAIERLRYAEEHAVRREAGDLAPLRRRVQTLVDGGLVPD